MTGTKVVRVVFDGTKATGVEIVADKETEEGADQTPHIINARKLVVVCGGAFGSPAILERSGVGSAQLLERLDIPVLVDLPGVGEGYQGMRPSYPLTALRVL